MLSLLSVFWAVGHYGGPMYKDWAEGQVNKIKGILNAAREDHTTAVKQRIENVKELGGVIDVTKSLFEVSKVGSHRDGYGLVTKLGLILSLFRKPQISRPKPLSSSKELLWQQRPSQYWIRGCDMKDKSRQGNSASLPSRSSARSPKNWRTPKPCSKSYSKVLLMWRVSSSGAGILSLDTADLLSQKLWLKSRNEPSGYPVHTAAQSVQNLLVNLSR